MTHSSGINDISATTDANTILPWLGLKRLVYEKEVLTREDDVVIIVKTCPLCLASFITSLSIRGKLNLCSCVCIPAGNKLGGGVMCKSTVVPATHQSLIPVRSGEYTMKSPAAGREKHIQKWRENCSTFLRKVCRQTEICMLRILFGKRWLH
jgi:hypothetical protein